MEESIFAHDHDCKYCALGFHTLRQKQRHESLFHVAEQMANDPALPFEARTEAGGKLAVCGVCTDVSGASFYVRDVLVHSASSYHLRHHQTVASASLQRGQGSEHDGINYDKPDLSDENDSVDDRSNRSLDSFHEDDTAEDGSHRTGGSFCNSDEDSEEGQSPSDWLGRPKDRISSFDHELAGSIFLCPFNYPTFPHELSEQFQDGSNFSRYRVVGARVQHEVMFVPKEPLTFNFFPHCKVHSFADSGANDLTSVQF